MLDAGSTPSAPCMCPPPPYAGGAKAGGTALPPGIGPPAESRADTESRDGYARSPPDVRAGATGGMTGGAAAAVVAAADGAEEAGAGAAAVFSPDQQVFAQNAESVRGCEEDSAGSTGGVASVGAPAVRRLSKPRASAGAGRLSRLREEEAGEAAAEAAAVLAAEEEATVTAPVRGGS